MTSFLIVLCLAILLHELGHFTVAKMVGVRVLRFSIGFGPKLLGFKRGYTEYVIAPIPLGGYVKMAGDNPEEGLEGKPWEFLSVSPWKRMAIVVAGPLMNFVLAFGIYYFIALLPGVETIRSVRVADVEKNWLAARAGILPGDEIREFDSEPLKSWSDFEMAVDRAVVAAANGGATEARILVSRRNEEKRSVETLPLRVDLSPYSPKQKGAWVRYLKPGSVAERAGIEIGDRIIRVGDTKISNWENTKTESTGGLVETMGTRYLEAADGKFLGKPTEIVWLRPSGEKRSGTIVPEIVMEGGKPRTLIGIGSQRPFKNYLDWVWPTEPVLGLRPWVNPVVGWVQKNSPAGKQGIAPGDEVIAINGEPIDHWYQMAGLIYASYHEEPAAAAEIPSASKESNAGSPQQEGGESSADAESLRGPRSYLPNPITITWKRPVGEPRTETITPLLDQETDPSGQPLVYTSIGIRPKADRDRKGLLGSLSFAGSKLYSDCGMFYRVITGVVRGLYSTKIIGGPIAIATMAMKQGAYGWEPLFVLLALLSANLAVINLFPIPIFDGGYVLIFLIEAVRRKRMTLHQMELFLKSGLVVIIPLIILIIYNDLSRFELTQNVIVFIKNLF
jgi:regulator of sigma E protease